MAGHPESIPQTIAAAERRWQGGAAERTRVGGMLSVCGRAEDDTVSRFESLSSRRSTKERNERRCHVAGGRGRRGMAAEELTLGRSLPHSFERFPIDNPLAPVAIIQPRPVFVG